MVTADHDGCLDPAARHQLIEPQAEGGPFPERKLSEKTTKTITNYDPALSGGYAVGYFESWNLESLKAVIKAAEEVQKTLVFEEPSEDSDQI